MARLKSSVWPAKTHERRREDAEAKGKEIDRLKAEARKEIWADLEARVNTKPLTKDDLAKTVPYFDDTAARTA